MSYNDPDPYKPLKQVLVWYFLAWVYVILQFAVASWHK